MLDTNIGLVANFPVFVLVVALGFLGLLVRRPHEPWSVDVLVAWGAVAVFLGSFAQAFNVHSGATPSLSRYALRLVPLGIPMIRRVWTVNGLAWPRVWWGAAILSTGVSVFVFHPGVKENAREPTILASYLWTRHPGWTGAKPEDAVKLGWAHGALLTIFPSDTTMATVENVKAFARGGSARIQR